MDGKFKILMTTDTLGGVWTYSVELIKALAIQPIEFHLLGFGGKASPAQLKELEQLENVIFYSSDLKLEWMEHPDIQDMQEKVLKLKKQINPDLMHFNNYIKTDEFKDIPTITVFHSCVLSWWRAVKNKQAPGNWDNYFHLVADALNAADQAVFPSQAIKETAHKIYPIFKDSVVIPNGRQLDIPENPEKEKIILCTGRVWDKAKNLELLCSMNKHLPWPVYVAGENKHPGKEQKIFLPKILFLGKLDSEELKKWYCKAEIFVSPALYEPFGLGILEAAQAGCALVLSDINSLQEIWKDAALYFNPKNQIEMQDHLISLIENSFKRSKYRNAAKERAALFNRKTFGERYLDLYKSLLNRDEFSMRKQSTSQISTYN